MLLAASLLAALFSIQTSSASPPDIRSYSANETYAFVTAWDNAPLPEMFKEPRGIAVDSGGNVYVADTGNYRIQKFTADGVFITDWGTEGSWRGRFKVPAAIAADSAGGIYVGDLWGGGYDFQKFNSSGEFQASWYRVQKFDPDGVFVIKWGSLGSDNGQFDTPLGIAVDSDGFIYKEDLRCFRHKTNHPNAPGPGKAQHGRNCWRLYWACFRCTRV